MSKVIILCFLALLFFSSESYSQKIEQNEIDEFTGDMKKATSFEPLYMGMDFTAYYSFKQINKSYYLRLRIMLGSGGVFAIGKEDQLMLKLSNSDILKLKSLSHEITSRGGGAKGLIGSNAMGLETHYKITEEELELLKKQPLSKVRIYTTKNYLEASINSNKALKGLIHNFVFLLLSKSILTL